MPYTLPTLAQAQADLASRLNDPAYVRWTSAELARYIAEALRTWSAWTSHWRESGTFVTTLNEPFYDLPTVLPALRGQTVTNWDLVLDMQYALMEPPSAAVWTGTEQFTLEQLSLAIQRRRDQFLRETGSVLTRSQTPFPANASGRFDLDQAILQIRRAAWRPDTSQLLLPLIRTDEWSATNYAPAWLASTQPPTAYSVSATPPLSLQVFPKPSGAGTLDLVSLNKGAVLSPGVESSLGVPDDWAWVIKMGALADVLNGDGLALDTPRMAYFEQRWQQGVDLAKKASVVLDARINGVTCLIGSLSDADAYSPTWQLVAAVPRQILLAGQTLLASYPPPGATGGQWTIYLDVVRNAPVPVNAGDVLQVSQDVYDSILDYAQHLAISKEGPGELEASLGLLDRFARAAGVDLRLQQAAEPSRSPTMQQQRTDEHALPRELDAVAIE